MFSKYRSSRAVSASWLLVGAAVVGLLAAYDALPQRIPIARTPTTGEWTSWAPKSIASVLRIPLMGFAQLGAATVMRGSAARQGAAHWARFWTTLSVVAAAKTAVETLQLASLGAPLPSIAEPLFYVASLLPVLLGVGWAGLALWPHRRALGQPKVNLREGMLLGVCLAAWASGVGLPLL